jgi:hypothetical protein
MTTSKQLLTLAGCLSLAVAAFQFILTFSPTLCRFFGAPEELLTGDPLWLYLTSFSATALFGIWGLYGLSGAGRIRRLPLLRTGLLAIGGIYTLRGLLLIPAILAAVGLVPSDLPVPPQALLASLVALSTGVLYLVGTFGSLQDLRPRPKSA